MWLSARILPVVQVRLQLAALHLLLALCVVGTGHHQFVQQVPHQQAGGSALVQLQTLPIHGAKVLLLQEVAETVEAVSVSTRSVHGSEERLQANVTNQLIVHLVLILVQVSVLNLVMLAAFFTNASPGETRRPAAGNGDGGGFGFCCCHCFRKFSPLSAHADGFQMFTSSFLKLNRSTVTVLSPGLHPDFLWREQNGVRSMAALQLALATGTGNHKSRNMAIWQRAAAASSLQVS